MRTLLHCHVLIPEILGYCNSIAYDYNLLDFLKMLI